MLIFLPKADKKSELGFSLLEILVVLAIIGTLLSLVSVNFSDSINQARFLKSTKTAVASLQSVRVEAALEQKSILLVTDDTNLSGWKSYNPNQIRRIQMTGKIRISGDPIEIGPSGFCNGGELSFSGEDGRWIRYVLQEPDCLITATN